MREISPFTVAGRAVVGIRVVSAAAVTSFWRISKWAKISCPNS